MSYVVWLHVENDDEADSDPSKAWWSLGQHVLLSAAIEQAEAIVTRFTEATGIVPERLEGEEEEE